MDMKVEKKLETEKEEDSGYESVCQSHLCVLVYMH
jgi:hypothetical protein